MPSTLPAACCRAAPHLTASRRTAPHRATPHRTAPRRATPRRNRVAPRRAATAPFRYSRGDSEKRDSSCRLHADSATELCFVCHDLDSSRTDLDFFFFSDVRTVRLLYVIHTFRQMCRSFSFFFFFVNDKFFTIEIDVNRSVVISRDTRTHATGTNFYG